jgi:hypothetical protein
VQRGDFSWKLTEQSLGTISEGGPRVGHAVERDLSVTSDS